MLRNRWQCWQCCNGHREALTEVLRLRSPAVTNYGPPAAPSGGRPTRSGAMASRRCSTGRRYQKGLNWITATAMAGFHVGAVAAFFFIDSGAILTALMLYVVAGMLGIGMAYHRLLTHRSYKTYKWVEYALTWCATLALEGGPIFWVATHRIHHQHSDRGRGPAHAARGHMVGAHGMDPDWGDGMHHDASVLARYVPDLVRDRVHVGALDLALDVERDRRSRAAGVRRRARTCCGASSSGRRWGCTRRGWSTRRRTSGDRAASPPATIRPTTGGWRS